MKFLQCAVLDYLLDDDRLLSLAVEEGRRQSLIQASIVAGLNEIGEEVVYVGNPSIVTIRHDDSRHLPVDLGLKRFHRLGLDRVDATPPNDACIASFAQSLGEPVQPRALVGGTDG